ncbi:MAG TPA: hypothetical protein VII22_20725 [Streptosporangiaceae bacterium]
MMTARRVSHMWPRLQESLRADRCTYKTTISTGISAILVSPYYTAWL